MERGILTALLAACLLGAGAADGLAQGVDAPTGSTASALGGIVLGGYSGTVLGLLGTMGPCNRTMAGGGCAASGAAVGGALALAMGGIVGGRNEDEILTRLESAGWGAAAGAIVGAAAWRGIRQYGWTDAVAMAAVGGAIGAAPVGSGIGGAAGATAGALAWWLVPDRGLPDLVMLTLAGVMIGGLAEWSIAAANADDGPAPFSASFAVPLG